MADCMFFLRIVQPSRNAEPQIAPGAENVGQAQILTGFSKPFELEGLFSAADAGAFTEGGDMQVDGGGDADGDEMFYDAQEDLDVAGEEEVEMEA